IARNSIKTKRMDNEENGCGSVLMLSAPGDGIILPVAGDESKARRIFIALKMHGMCKNNSTWC
ncbi:MAG: hypothetical protein WC071_11250, partial [Victivallaceae bacterium]